MSDQKYCKPDGKQGTNGDQPGRACAAGGGQFLALAVLNNNNGAATLTEIGFISNPTEAKTMAANLSNYGSAVYNAVLNASNAYPTNR